MTDTIENKRTSWDRFPNGLSVVIPVYNEQATLRELVGRVQSQNLAKEIILIDDCSSDGTKDVVKELEAESNGKIVALYHERNQGKGAALRTGFAKVTGDIVLVQDADLEYDPRDYGNLLEPLLDGRADVVYGSRFLGGPHRVLFFWHYVVNRMLTFLSNICTNLNLTDMEVGYKLFKKDVLDKITIKSDRFNFEPEITAKVAKMKLRIYEVPISYSGRTYEEGKKIGVADGVEALWTIFKYRFVD